MGGRKKGGQTGKEKDETQGLISRLATAWYEAPIIVQSCDLIFRDSLSYWISGHFFQRDRWALRKSAFLSLLPFHSSLPWGVTSFAWHGPSGATMEARSRHTLWYSAHLSLEELAGCWLAESTQSQQLMWSKWVRALRQVGPTRSEGHMGDVSTVLAGTTLLRLFCVIRYPYFFQGRNRNSISHNFSIKSITCHSIWREDKWKNLQCPLLPLVWGHN